MQPAETGRTVVAPRFEGVDVLRGLSILSVMLLHVSLVMSFYGFHAGDNLPPWLAGLLFRNGYGVATFFTVSGFLITLTSLRRFGRLSAMRPAVFYRIRFARIAPPLLLLLFVLSILHLTKTDTSEYQIQRAVTTLPRALFAALTFHLNWLQAAHGWLPPGWSVLWSLSVEEMFYAFFPLLCAGLLGKSWGWPVFLSILCGFVVVGPFARSVFTANSIWQNESYLSSMDGIALGCLCALIVNQATVRVRPLDPRWLLLSQVAGALLMFFVAAGSRENSLTRPLLHALDRTGTNNTVLMVGSCLVMFGCVLRPGRSRLWTAPVRWFGRHSYEIYLTHEFVVLGVASLFLKTHWHHFRLCMCLLFGGTALVGFLVAHFFSEPANRALRGGPLPWQLRPMAHA